MTGIYKITNLINGKMYVGSAINFYKRISEHKRVLIKNKHHSSKLQNAWNKYGADSFTFEIIELCEANKNILIEKEQYYIDLYNVVKFGYNCSPKAGSPLGYKHTDQTKRNMSEAHIGNVSGHKGKKHSKEAIKKIILARTKQTFSQDSKNKMSESHKGRKAYQYNPTPIIQLDLDNNLIKEWKDMIELREAGYDADHISEVCRGKRKTYLKHIWKFNQKTFL